jgi:hypothetical protein
VFAHVGNPEDGGFYSCTLVSDLDQFLLGRPEALAVFFRIYEVSKSRHFFENLRLDRFVESLSLG